MPSRTKFRFGGDPKGSIDDKVYTHLASRPNLTSLTTNRTTKLDLIQNMQVVVKHPFPELVHLVCDSESKAIGQLSRHLTRLTKLHLVLVDAAENMVFDICSCTSLVSLELYFTPTSHFDAKSHFPPESLVALAESCSHLQDFNVMHRLNPRENHGVTDINDDVVQEFVALLLGLSRFRLQIKINVTDRALQILGEGCPNMKDCALGGEDFDLRLVGSSGPVLFPQLDILQLTQSVGGPSADEVAKVLCHHAPRARILDVGGSWAFEKELRQEIQELKRQNQARPLATVL